MGIEGEGVVRLGALYCNRGPGVQSRSVAWRPAIHYIISIPNTEYRMRGMTCRWFVQSQLFRDFTRTSRELIAS
jgi:hypothetical protein